MMAQHCEASSSQTWKKNLFESTTSYLKTWPAHSRIVVRVCVCSTAVSVLLIPHSRLYIFGRESVLDSFSKPLSPRSSNPEPGPCEIKDQSKSSSSRSGTWLSAGRRSRMQLVIDWKLKGSVQLCVYTWFGSFLFRSYYIHYSVCVYALFRFAFSLSYLFLFFPSLFFLFSLLSLHFLNWTKAGKRQSATPPPSTSSYLRDVKERNRIIHERPPFFHLFLLLPFLRECRTSLASCAAVFHT